MNDAVRGGTFGLGEGSTGEYRPEPLEYEVARLKGGGLAGVEDAPLMDRAQHLEAVRTGQLGSIHSWELVTAVDGPGTRLTVFLNGCPLRCVYCHNPDTFKMRDGRPVMASDIIKLMKRYEPIFKATNGGLTLSGGEPAMQPAFLRTLLTAAKERNIHTTIDTSGFLGNNIDDEMLKNIDLVLLDIKSGNPSTYKKVTGRELAPTIEFGERLNAAGKPMWIRFVVVPGWTDQVENVEKIAQIVKPWTSVQRIEVLPFHQMARDKWAELGLNYQLKTVDPPSKETVEKVREILRSTGITIY